jgi:hypothetical protein
LGEQQKWSGDKNKRNLIGDSIKIKKRNSKDSSEGRPAVPY